MALASRGLAHGALCSVNVEVLQTGSQLFQRKSFCAAGGCHARLCGLGVSWWRWGWKACLKAIACRNHPISSDFYAEVRGAQAKRCALGVDEVVKKYGVCASTPQSPTPLQDFTRVTLFIFVSLLFFFQVFGLRCRVKLPVVNHWRLPELS